MNKKFILLAIIVILSVGTYAYIKEEKNKISYKEEVKVRIGDEAPSIEKYVAKKDLKKIDNKKISWKKLKTEDNKVYYAGTYNGSFKFKGKEKNIKLIVVDDEEPVITNVKDIQTYEKDKVDFLKDIKVTDNSHDKVDIKVEGKYDLDKKGEYELTYVAIDKSNNKKEEKFKLIVKEKTKDGSVVVGTSSKGYTIAKKNGIFYVDGILIANKTYSLPKTYSPGGLLNIFNTNFNTMKNAASKDNISLRVVSGFRSYNTQATLYNNYVKQDGKANADTYSARPGHSEHQTGLAADINSASDSFNNTKEAKWLNENCYKYGFIIRYPKGKEKETGYMYESWHIRYVGVELATKLYNNGNWITLEEYLGITSKY